MQRIDLTRSPLSALRDRDGRPRTLSDLLADYSPYRPIDDMKRTDGLNDLHSHRCPHNLGVRNADGPNLHDCGDSLGDIAKSGGGTPIDPDNHPE